MDWVHQKESRRKNRGQKPTSGHSHVGSHASATLWLEELCLDNLEKLQANLPLPNKSLKTKRTGKSFETLSAIQWGLESLLPEERQDIDALTGLLALSNEESPSDPSKHSSPEKLATWLSQQLPVRSDEVCIALVAAGWIHGLPKLGRSIAPSTWLETLQTILTQVDRSWAAKEPAHLLSWLIWSCEIPLALATQLAHLGSKDRIVCETLDRLAACIETAGETPHVWITDGGRHLRALLACVARCRFTANRLGARKWYRAQRKALISLVSIAISLSDRWGHPLFVEAGQETPNLDFWKAMTNICGNSPSIIRLLRSNFGKKFSDDVLDKQDSNKATLPALGFYNEKAELAVLRSSWSSHVGRVGVDFSSDTAWLDIIGLEGQRLISGPWDLLISKNGKPLELSDPWTEVCWFSDDDVDYLEIECKVEGECRVQRQIMLARDESIVVVADALLGFEIADWSIESRMPLENGIYMRQDDKTREAVLCEEGKSSDELPKQMALLLPLSLPEWRRQNSRGELVSEDDCIVTTQNGRSQRLYSPLVISLKKRHQSQEYTWRQLTVAESMSIQTVDVAAAFRFQIGKEQWMIYRSLAETRRRTAMGLHFNVEFYAGRFDGSEGEFESLVEVDSPE